jgi:hypothetical protein
MDRGYSGAAAFLFDLEPRAAQMGAISARRISMHVA